MGRWLIILWFTMSKCDGWVFIGEWAAIRTNMVPPNLIFKGSELPEFPK